jgi:glycerol-3-phosphate O-acyltransferase/dihydroxyacetone phosphate acyltransferase
VLHHGGSIGIFPEGGSHDRTDLLPLKGNTLWSATNAPADRLQLVLQLWPLAQ